MQLNSIFRIFFRKTEFWPKIGFSPLIEEPAELFCVFHIFTWKSLLYLKFSLPFIVRWIFKIVFFRLKAHFIRKNWLLVHRTTLWASFSHIRVSMVLFYSTSARPGPSVIRDSFGVMKILSFFKHKHGLDFHFFSYAWEGIGFFHHFLFVCSKDWIFCLFSALTPIHSFGEINPKMYFWYCAK